MQYASVERLGPTQSRLASGALLVKGVPIARSGTQAYHASELAGAIDDDTSIDDAGMIQVLRHPDDVFAPAAIASFEAAPLVMRHPDDAVSPDNWSELAVGHAQNVHRDGDLLVADLVIHDARGIDAIRNRGWRAVSCGYDASYVPLPDGRLRQVGIAGNHIALLAPGESARCGERCAVGDAGWYFGGDTVHTHDQESGFREGAREVKADIREARRPPNIAKIGGGDYGVGPVIVAVLKGPASGYSIMADGDGRAVLVWHSNIENKLDPGRAMTGDARQFRQAARERAAREQEAGRVMADRISTFWKQQAAHG